jgi:tetratricopeptide (TPR) repeat protein
VEADRLRSWPRIAAWVGGIIAVATIAGLLLADVSGSRGAGDGITGDIRDSVRTRLFDAQGLLGSDPERAIELYDSVLDDEPSSAEALTYRGWLTNVALGEPELAADYLDEAIAADPTYPDARVFAASLALGAGDPVGAKAQLDALEGLDAPPFVEQLVQGQGLRVRVVEGLLSRPVDEPFTASGLTVDEVARAADQLLQEGEVSRAIAVFEVMRAEIPEDLDFRTAFGWFVFLLTRVAPDEAGDRLPAAKAELDAVLEAEPDRPDALVYRAYVNLYLDDLDAADADLTAYDALDAGRDDLDLLVDQGGLRDALA